MSIILYKINRLKSILTFIIVLVSITSLGQNIKIKAHKKPLNKLLIELRDQYNIEFSYNDVVLSQYKISINKNFNSAKQALKFIAKSLNLELKISDSVFIIYPKQTIVKKLKKKTILFGQIIDELSLEPLPYSTISVNGYGMMTDFQGKFSFISETDSIFNINASHLGYYKKDTISASSKNFKIKLSPSVYKLEEIIIKTNPVNYTTNIGEIPGKMRFNNKIAKYIPGNSDNSVFNLLRLHPGITAAGEQTNDLIIRGCYPGQSKVYFDGFSVFGLKNFNDNISAVNPFLIKDIGVLKSNFDSEYGNISGAIINITGINGNKNKIETKINIDNMTLNGMINIPLSKNINAIIASRQTYYDIYDTEKISFIKRKSTRENIFEVNPNYQFNEIGRAHV